MYKSIILLFLLLAPPYEAKAEVVPLLAAGPVAAEGAWMVILGADAAVKVGVAGVAAAGYGVYRAGKWVKNRLFGFAGNGNQDKLPTNPKGDMKFEPKKQKGGGYKRDRLGRYIDDKDRAWFWDKIKEEWDVTGRNGKHDNVNTNGMFTHPGTNK